ncbi:hypothetical protein EDD85DRAFT_440489 [Armillaria nabsnona]|nr:hypothetical protein EDD85DRAFT_440489 [Armillaria nabsnona]
MHRSGVRVFSTIPCSPRLPPSLYTRRRRYDQSEVGFNTGDGMVDYACLDDSQEEAHSFLLDFASSREKCTFPPSSAVFVAPTWPAHFGLAPLAESAAPNAIMDVCRTIPLPIRQRTSRPKAIIHLVKCDRIILLVDGILAYSCLAAPIAMQRKEPSLG